MVTRQYRQTMARYNTWQNSQLAGFPDALEPEQVTGDCGGFFGSALGALNHLSWGDAVWTVRFDHGGGIPGTGERSAVHAGAGSEAGGGLGIRGKRPAERAEPPAGV